MGMWVSYLVVDHVWSLLPHGLYGREEVHFFLHLNLYIRYHCAIYPSPELLCLIPLLTLSLPPSNNINDRNNFSIHLLLTAFNLIHHITSLCTYYHSQSLSPSHPPHLLSKSPCSFSTLSSSFRHFLWVLIYHDLLSL